jgi:protein phosphatase
MGGVAGGELAAQLAIDAMRRHLESNPPRTASVALQAAILEANRVIVLRRQNPLFGAMGTTAVGVMFQGAEVSIAHAGDSRLYVIRDGSIEQLTTDHTFVQQLVASGEITPAEALDHPQAHVLTKCLGHKPGLDASEKSLWLWEEGPGGGRDTLLLCTDGLYSLVSDKEIAAAVSDMTSQRACVHLVELAKSRGGFDNVTIAIVPLDGVLREAPPVGYKPRDYAMEARIAEEVEASKLSYFRLFMVWLVAGIAAMVIVFLAMSFWVSK